MSKQYNSLHEFQDATFARLRNVLRNPPLRFQIRNIMGGDDEEWASVELLAKDAVCKSGTYGLGPCLNSVLELWMAMRTASLDR